MVVQTAMESQSRDIADRANAIKLQEAEKEIARRNRPYNINISPLLTAFDRETPEYEEFRNHLKTVTGATEDGVTTLENYEKAKYAIAQDETVMGSIIKGKLNKLMVQRDSLAEKAENARNIGDAEGYKKLSAQVTAFDDRIHAASGKKHEYDLAMAKMREANAQKEADRASRESIAEENRKSRELIAEGNRRTQEEIAKGNQALRKDLAGDRNKLSFGDKEALRALGKQLPKTKLAAETAVKNVQKIDRMLDLIDRGAGGVKGEVLAKINKVADVMRRTPPEDAKYNTLKAELRGFAGQLRLQLGLIGQTSDRDVAIMYEAAGGASPAESQKAIIGGYRQAYLQDINVYNSDAEAYREFSDVAKKTYKPIIVSERQAGSPTATSLKSFASEADAAGAAKRGEIKVGDRITIGGQPGTWR